MKTWAAIVALALAGGAALGQARPDSKVLDCTTAGCHASEMGHAFLHGPTAVSACDACHEYESAPAHTFRLKRQGKQLCEFCHIDKTGREAPFAHEPVAKGECTACHDPHGSATRLLLKKATTREMCLECHQDAMTGAHRHKPVDDDCLQCHKAHTAPHAKLLSMERRALCLSCHEDIGKAIAGSPHPHEPAAGDCLQCHRPHAAEHPKVLSQAPKDLCLSCHAEVGTAMTSASHPHSATGDARACLNCHVAHQSHHVKQLLPDPVKSCLECHSKPVEAKGGRMVMAVAEIGDPTAHKHGPINDGDCAACHEVHGGSRAGLLLASFEQDFYRSYDDKAYALCFTCHDRALVTAQPTGEATGFRDGERNLHAVHVTKSPQGRSCRACHASHASRHGMLIADSVQFGQWRLPINFVKTDRGGSCGPGCHKPAAYDRGPGPSAPPPAVRQR